MWRERWVRYPAVAAVASAVALVATLALDAAVSPAAWLPLSAAGARALLGSIAGAIVTATAVVFWVRSMMLQMAGAQFPSRILLRYVESRFDQAVLAYLIGVFVYTLGVLFAVPSADDPAPLPRLSITVAAVLALGMLLAIVAVIRHSVRAANVGQLLQQITDDTLAAAADPAASADVEVLPPDTCPPDRPGCVIRCAATGWVRTIDIPRLLGALPPGATMRCEVRFGQLCTPGDVLATWWSDDGEAVDPAEVAAAMPLGASHDSDHDVVLGVHHLVDVTVSSTSAGTERTAAYEALKHLQAVLRAALVRPPASALAGEQGRVLLLPPLWSDHLVDDAFHPIREALGSSPTLALALLRTLGGLRRDVEEGGHGRWTPALQRHAALVLRSLERSDALDEEVERSRAVARDEGLLAGAEAGG